MTAETEQLIAKLESASWFSRCGIVGEPLRADEILIKAWDQVGQYGSRQEWDDTCLEAANWIRDSVQRISWERYEEWNGIVLRIKPLTEALIARKCAGLSVPNEFVESARWDILHSAIETEYADTPTPGFYARLAIWYAAGHFPCAWVGEYPDGKLVIY
jgi:hypothetical protein